MKQYYYLIIFYILVICPTISFGQNSFLYQGPQPDIYGKNTKSFEGLIRFHQIINEDTLLYTYFIKDRMVRMDIHENNNPNIPSDSYMLFYLDQKLIYAFKPSRKVYKNVVANPYISTNDENFRIIKSANSKRIHGYNCYQWRVRNKNQNTEVSYWVANDQFDFFEDFLKLWNRSEKHASYFLKIPDTKGFFPLLSEERTTLREEKMTLKVVDIQRKTLDNSFFEIPKDYRNYDH